MFERLAGLEPPEDAPVLFDTACVLGGSVAGLLAARVLADHARRVIVIDRDLISTDGESRPGVPQDRHTHTLLAGGHDWIERWLPGFTKEMTEKGAVATSPSRLRAFIDGAPVSHPREERLMVLASRPFMESRLREEVLRLPNVETIRAQVTGLVYSRGQVSAVQYAAGPNSHEKPADLVVDAAGRGSRLPEWLAHGGYQAPEIRRVPCRVNYVTAKFSEVKLADELPHHGVVARWAPPYPVSGLCVAAVNKIERGQWLMFLGAYGDIKPAQTLAELRKTCAELPFPLFEDVSNGILMDTIATYRLADNRRRDFDESPQLPARLVSLGDSVASFNPLFGQGMAVAAFHASCLSMYLNTMYSPDEPATAFFALQRIVVDAAWSVSADADVARLGLAEAAGGPERRKAVGQVMQARLNDSVLARAVDNVAWMLKHPDTLTDPAIQQRAAAVNAEVG